MRVGLWSFPIFASTMHLTQHHEAHLTRLADHLFVFIVQCLEPRCVRALYACSKSIASLSSVFAACSMKRTRVVVHPNPAFHASLADCLTSPWPPHRFFHYHIEDTATLWRLAPFGSTVRHITFELRDNEHKTEPVDFSPLAPLQSVVEISCHSKYCSINADSLVSCAPRLEVLRVTGYCHNIDWRRLVYLRVVKIRLYSTCSMRDFVGIPNLEELLLHKGYGIHDGDALVELPPLRVLCITSAAFSPSGSVRSDALVPHLASLDKLRFTRVLPWPPMPQAEAPRLQLIQSQTSKLTPCWSSATNCPASDATP